MPLIVAYAINAAMSVGYDNLLNANDIKKTNPIGANMTTQANTDNLTPTSVSVKSKRLNEGIK